jgi:hypothetical protein
MRCYKYINLMYLTFVVLVMGSFISFVYPQKYVFEMFDRRWVIDGWVRFWFVDVFMHLGMFLFILVKYGAFYKSKLDDSLMYAGVLLVLYLIVFYRPAIYQLSLLQVLSLFVIASSLYVMLFVPCT